MYIIPTVCHGDQGSDIPVQGTKVTGLGVQRSEVMPLAVSGLWLPAARVSDFSKCGSGCWLQCAGAGRGGRGPGRFVDGAGRDRRPEWVPLGRKEEQGPDPGGQAG